MKDTNDLQGTSARYVELDALRGLAAMTVVLHHIRILWQTDTQPSSPILLWLLSLVSPIGTEAVILFFVLSGFVLSLPAIAGRPQTYSTFVIRRIFRIYVPFLAAIVVSIVGAQWLHGAITRSDWFHYSWSEPVHWQAVVQHIVFVGFYNTWQFDNPIWSLVHEMRISLVFPFLCAYVLQLKNRSAMLFALLLTVAAIAINVPPFSVRPSLGDSLQAASLFVLGIVLARERNRLGAWFHNTAPRLRLVLLAVFLWLYLFAVLPLNRVPISAGMTGLFLTSGISFAGQWLTAIGAAGLMIFGMNSAAGKRFLRWSPIHFLGEVSYSLYLWHFIVMLYCVHLLYGKIPLPFILGFTFVLTLAVSWCSYHWIEAPSMKFGRRFSSALELRREVVMAKRP